MGGGGGGSRNYFRDITPKENDCDKLFLTVDLQNIQPAVKDYAVNDILNIELDHKERIHAIGKHGVCGYVGAVQASQLLKCLSKGKLFKALVLKITTTTCQVRITPDK